VAPARSTLLRQRRLSGVGLCVSRTLPGHGLPRPKDQTRAQVHRQPRLRYGWINAFDYHGLTTEQRLLAFGFKRGRRFFPGWDATLVDLPTDVLVSEQRSREIEGLWLREPKQFLYDALPRARNFLDKFGDIRRRLTASASCTSRDAG
jgi:hypothetical protein